MVLHKKLDYKWVVLVICFLMEFICLGFCSSNMGLYTVPVTSALGIDRLAYSYWASIRYAAQVFMALYFGTLVNKFGIRKMVLAGLACLIGASVLRSVGTNVWHFYISGVLHGFAVVFVGSTMAGAIVRRWFKQDIGKYTGIVMSANGSAMRFSYEVDEFGHASQTPQVLQGFGIGGAIAAQIISPIINNGETFGYRKAYLLSALIALVVGIIVLLLLRDNPTDGPVIPLTGKKKQPKGALWIGIEYAIVKKKAYFYIAAAMVFLTGISLQSIGSITIVYMTDLGISQQWQRSLLSRWQRPKCCPVQPMTNGDCESHCCFASWPDSSHLFSRD